MDILISVAAKIAEFTVEPIGRQVGYLLCYKNNLKELQDQVEELKKMKEGIDHEVEAEERNLREIYDGVRTWRQGVIKFLKEEKLCKGEPHASVRCWKWSFPNLKLRHQLGRKAKKMTNTIVEMKKNWIFDKGVGYDRHLDITNNLPAIRGNDGLESRKSVQEDVVMSLKDPKVSRIGVYGIGGVGKTTLVKQVAKQVKDDKLFDAVVMVTVSQTNLERIQDEIAEQLGLRTLKEITSLIGRASCLYERIKKEKTILIILDDLQEKTDLDELGIPSLDTWGKMNPEKVGVPLKEDYKGCKLLLTSRSQDILQKNDAQKNFSLQVLNDEESWSLFEAMVGDVVQDDNFRNIATQVAQRCLGLPVLIVTIAKSLKHNKYRCYWEDTLTNLKGGRDMNEIISSALEFSFIQLEDEVKKVFLLCGVHGASIVVSDLLKYAIGLGIFKCINTIKDSRNRLDRIIIDLKASCLLVNDDARGEIIKMHDIIHEVAISMASKYSFTKINAKLQDWPGKDILERCTHIILYRCCIQKLPERLDCPHLTFLHINSFDNRTLEIPKSFFEGMGNLEALDLTGMIIASLPISLSSLTKLKTLCLDHCSLKDMTGISALTNLEILSLIHSSMEEFPREIKQLTKLRMLDLRRSGNGTTLPNILCKLTKIEELYLGDARIKWEVESSATQKRNASLAKLGDLASLTTLEIQIREARLLPEDIAFEKLERYKVVIGDNWEWPDNKETSRLLKVKLDTNICWQWGIKTLIKRVEDLYLDEISGISNVLFDLNGEGFPLLRHLHIQNNGEIRHIVNSMNRNQTHVLFPELETMILHNLNNLVKICYGSVRDVSFGKLKIVKVKSCDQLEYLFSVSMVKAFSQLVEIEVSECSSMKKIISIESTDSGKTIDEKIEFLPLRSLTLQHLPAIDYFFSHELTSSLGTMENLLRDNISTVFFTAKVKFSNLETLKLSSINLKNFWDDSSAPHLVHNLANLIVEDCNGLKYLFLSSVVGRLSNLKQLEISKCDMMEEIIATEEINGVIVGEVLFPKLEAIIIKDMQNLKTIWHLILASSSLACLKTLNVKNCEKIERIFPEYMNGAFATLETLKVEECKSVQEIFQLGDNADDKPQLKYITLLQLPQLKQVWSRDPQSSHCFKSLQGVRVEDCGHLEYLFPFSIAEHLPQLEAITIKNAEKMTEIVSKREGPLDNDVNFEFDQLTSIVLWNLHDLQGFYAGNHSLSCSSLKELNVSKCRKLKLFRTQCMSSQGRHNDDNLSVSMQQSLFTLEEVIDNLELLTLSNEDARMIFQSQVPRDQFRKLKVLRLEEIDAQATSPSWFLQNTSNLESLVIQDMCLRVIFPDERPQDENGEIEIKTRLKNLALYRLYELQHICKEGCQLDPVLEPLEYLWVFECSSLKHLVPSSVTFNQLTHLVLQNCNGLIYLITLSTARSLVNLTTLKIIRCDLVEQIVEEAGGESVCEIAFQSLQVLELESLPKLKMFCSSIICCLKLPVLEKLLIRQCPRMESFSASDTSTPLLREILTDEQDKKWFCEGYLNKTVGKMFQDKVAFRSAKHLELSVYPELKELWSSHVQMGIFSNLTNLVVHKCYFLSYVLLPFNLLKALTNLEKVQVSECDSLEAVFDLSIVNGNEVSVRETIQLKSITLSCLPELKHIWKQNYQETDCFREKTEEGSIQRGQPAYSSGLVVLPNLEAIIMKEMQNLETVWHPILCPNSMGNFQTLEISKCGKIENVYPLYMQGAFTSLETLTVTKCSSLKEIFQLDIKHEEHPTKLKNITLLQLPQLQQIWSGDSQSSLRLENLQIVCVEDCEDLEYIFPFSIAMSLLQIEQITIKNAGTMKEIFSGKEGPLDCPPKFEFNRMTSLALWDLPEFQGFFSKSHSLACPSLKILDVRYCSKWSLFKKQGATNEGKVIESNLQISTQRSPFPKEVICNLETLTLNYEDASMMVQGEFSGEQFHKLKSLILSDFEDDQAKFPYWLLQNIISLQEMVVETSSFKQIFRPEGQTGIQTRIKKLILSQLHELQDICKDGFQIDPVLELLECLDVYNCSKLKLLVPSSVTFNQLTYLVVQNCNGLIYLITSSTASSLVKLTTLKIRACNSLEQVMSKENEETVNEIEFSSLQVLELESLPRFKIFCSSKCILKLPFLTELLIVQCPRMKSFSMSNTSAPKLQKILTGKQDGKWCWEGGLNRTVDKIFQDKVAFSSFNHLELSEYPELKELWYDQVVPKIFCNLKRLVVRKCTFLSNVLFSSNLLQLLYASEELEVAECDLLEVVFDVKALDDKEMESKDVSCLKKLTLSGLPNLQRIWNREAEEIISFGNLQTVKVDKCQHLKYLFSVSQCQDFRQLEELHIESCGVEEIVSIEEGLLEELKFEFPRLIRLKLFNLTQLNNFCSKRCTLECPSLRILNVHGCEELPIFAFQDLNSQPLKEGDNELQIEQALFHIEKVSQNLEELSLNEKDARRILSGNYEKNLFQGIKILRLQHFQETPIKFLNGLIQKFPATTTIQVRRSSLETLFPSKEIDHCSVEIPSQIKKLWLFQLEQLKHIWNDGDSISHPLVGNLEYLTILECSRIKILAPPSASFKNLTSLGVKDCNGLLYFMTSCTAKSLINLTSLTVRNCGILEEVVMTNEGESEEEITFESLKYLELTCLSGFKSFCSGKHTFIFQSLVTLKVVECPKMQNFSSGVIIAPFLKLVEVENGKKHWKEGLNTTIKQLFINKAIGGVERDYIESSSIIQSSQTYQKSVGTSRALIFEKHVAESKDNEIVDSRKQEIQKVLNIPQIGADTQKICEIVETPLDQASQSTLSLTKVDAAIETEEMKENIQTPFADVVALTNTSVQETETLHSDIRNQEIYKTSEKALVPVAQNVLSSSMVDNIAINPSRSQALEAMTSSIQDAALQNQEMYKNGVERPFVQSAKIALSTTTVYDADKSQDLQLHPSESESLQVQTRSIMSDDEENTGNKELHETIQTLLVQNVEDMLIPASSVQDIAAEIHVSIDKPFLQAIQNAWDITIVEKKGESHDSDIHLSKNLFNQTITFTAPDNKETVGTQETYESKRSFSVPYAQNVLSSTIVYNTGKSYDPEIILENLSSQATSSAIAENRATIDQPPSTTPVANFCSIFKELDISVQLLPYLESGVKQHPQVLNWLNTKRRRVFASSYFSLFAEVTRILRTTEKGHLTEDDRNYIIECCGVLQGVAFDESWISYVHGFIEACGDGEDLINREVEEAEGEASNLKAQIESMKKELASIKESLALLCDKAQGVTIPSSSEVRRFSWRSTCKSIFIFITIYLLVCVLIYSLSNLPL